MLVARTLKKTKNYISILAAPCGMGHLRSLTRDQSTAPCVSKAWCFSHWTTGITHVKYQIAIFWAPHAPTILRRIFQLGLLNPHRPKVDL